MKKHLGLALLATMTTLYGQESVTSRGDRAMGFSHEKTTHHFRLSKNGGAIEVQADDAKDTASRDQIRGHLKHIVAMFSAGNFEMPMFIHDQVPPGVPAMKRLKSEIKYQIENTERGGRVRISSTNPEAVEALHEFLRFQITDHKTGDSLEVARALVPAASRLISTLGRPT